MPLPDTLFVAVGESVTGGVLLVEMDGVMLPVAVEVRVPLLVTLLVDVAVLVALLVLDALPVPLGEFDTVALLLDVPEPLIVTVGELEAVFVLDAETVPLPVAVRVSLVEPVAV